MRIIKILIQSEMMGTKIPFPTPRRLITLTDSETPTFHNMCGIHSLVKKKWLRDNKNIRPSIFISRACIAIAQNKFKQFKVCPK